MSLSNPNHSPLANRSSQLAVPADADPTYFLPKADPGRLLGVLFRRGWIVMAAAILGAIGLYMVANKLPKTYRATGSVQVSTQAPTILDIRPVAPEESRDLEQMRSVEQGLSASTLLLRVIEANHLADAPDFAPKGASQETLLQLLASRVKVELSRGSRIIVVQVDDTDPVRARTLVQSLVDEYEKWTTEKQLTITRKASEGLAREEEHLRKKMEESAKELQEFRKAHPVPGLEGSDSGSPVRDSLGGPQRATHRCHRRSTQA